MDFLKHEYGTGGHSHACSGATHSGQDHDAKGVAYTKSGCDKLQMSWAQVVQRIDGLIRKGRYLSPEEEAERQAIEEAKTDPLEDVYDRFAVIDTEDGEYAIWDNQTDDYYVDPEGVTEYFTDEWLANDYLEEVRQSVAAMESVQPETPATEPDEVVEAPVSEEPTGTIRSVTRYIWTIQLSVWSRLRTEKFSCVTLRLLIPSSVPRIVRISSVCSLRTKETMR